MLKGKIIAYVHVQSRILVHIKHLKTSGFCQKAFIKLFILTAMFKISYLCIICSKIYLALNMTLYKS